MGYSEELDDFIKQLNKITEIPNYFTDLCLENTKGTNKQKSIGIIGDEFYCLYARAYGLKPVLLNGGSFYLGEDASHLFPQISDPVAKSTMGFLFNEDLNILNSLDAIIISASNDSYKKVIHHVEKLGKTIIKAEPPSYLLSSMPMNYIFRQMKVLHGISKISNTRLSYRKLKRELKGYKQAYALTHTKEWKTIPTFVQDFFLHTLYLDERKDLWCENMEKYLQSIEAKPQVSTLMLMGSPLRFPTSKMYKIFSEIGISHFDNQCLALPDFQEIPLKLTSFFLLKECFKYQYKKSLTARTLLDIDELEVLNKPKGIVYYLLKGQMAEAYEAEQIEKIAIKHSIPFLCVETDYTNSDNEQIKIRIEAFYEMLKSKAL